MIKFNFSSVILGWTLTCAFLLLPQVLQAEVPAIKPWF